MLTVDMINLSETELQEIVARHLSPFGHAKFIKVMPRDQHRYGIVAVRMANRAQARYAAAQLGHSQYGPIVVIRLAQRGMTIPLPLQSQLVH